VLEDGNNISMNELVRNDMNLAGIPWLQKTTTSGIGTISHKSNMLPFHQSSAAWIDVGHLRRGLACLKQ
jgi:hypothetical protein